MSHKSSRLILFIIIFLFYYLKLPLPDPDILGTSDYSIPSPTYILEKTDNFKVTQVVDGDTIKVTNEGQIFVVRLIGVDTPEIVDPRKEMQCFAREASNYTKALLLGKIVSLESDPKQQDRDRYNRILRYVKTTDGIFANQEIIRNGYGYEYMYDLPYLYRQEFIKAQEEAKKEQKGLWADKVCS